MGGPGRAEVVSLCTHGVGSDATAGTRHELSSLCQPGDWLGLGLASPDFYIMCDSVPMSTEHVTVCASRWI